MKKLMMMSASVIALGALAQEVPVPPPVVAVETTVAVPAVPAASVVATASVVELEPGALCRTYFWDRNFNPNEERFLESYEEFLSSAVPVDQQYDPKSSKFDGKSTAKHDCNVVAWEGIFEAKVAGTYIFTVSSDLLFGIKVNGKGVRGLGQKTFQCDLQKGVNVISLWRCVPYKYLFTSRVKTDFSLDYRLAQSVKPAKPITPNMLKHIVEDEEEW